MFMRNSSMLKCCSRDYSPKYVAVRFFYVFVCTDRVMIRISGANSYVLDRDDGEGGIISEDHYILPIKLNSCRVLIPQVRLLAIYILRFIVSFKYFEYF